MLSKITKSRAKELYLTSKFECNRLSHSKPRDRLITRIPVEKSFFVIRKASYKKSLGKNSIWNIQNYYSITQALHVQIYIYQKRESVIQWTDNRLICTSVINAGK